MDPPGEELRCGLLPTDRGPFPTRQEYDASRPIINTEMPFKWPQKELPGMSVCVMVGGDGVRCEVGESAW